MQKLWDSFDPRIIVCELVELAKEDPAAQQCNSMMHTVW